MYKRGRIQSECHATQDGDASQAQHTKFPLTTINLHGSLTWWDPQYDVCRVTKASPHGLRTIVLMQARDINMELAERAAKLCSEIGQSFSSPVGYAGVMRKIWETCGGSQQESIGIIVDADKCTETEARVIDSYVIWTAGAHAFGKYKQRLCASLSGTKINSIQLN